MSNAITVRFTSTRDIGALALQRVTHSFQCRYTDSTKTEFKKECKVFLSVSRARRVSAVISTLTLKGSYLSA
jgi:hypothetical protein